MEKFDLDSLLENMIGPVEYRGYNIWPNSKSVNKHNPINGHSWTEQKLTAGFYISGPKMRLTTNNFKTVEIAKEWVDFLIKSNEFCEERERLTSSDKADSEWD